MARRKRTGSRSRRRTAKPGGGPAESPELQRLRGLLELMREHQLVELEIGADGQSVRMSKAGALASGVPAQFTHPAAPTGRTNEHNDATGAIAASGSAGDKPAVQGEPFLSPMVGTFYRGASPEATSFVAEGDAVKAEQTLCIIEAMKVMNEIKAERPGRVVQILVENGEAVEYGQPLFLIQRAG